MVKRSENLTLKVLSVGVGNYGSLAFDSQLSSANFFFEILLWRRAAAENPRQVPKAPDPRGSKFEEASKTHPEVQQTWKISPAVKFQC